MESGINHTSHEEICSRLTVGGFVPKVDEILARLLGRSKVCHLTLVDDANLVEEIVERLSGLVDGDDRRHPGHIGSNTKRLDELESGRSTDRGVSDCSVTTNNETYSRPRVELSQQLIKLLEAKASLRDTRFFCPPLTPRT